MEMEWKTYLMIVMKKEWIYFCIFNIVISDSPRNTTLQGTAQSVKWGASLNLTCSADAFPAPEKYEWLFLKGPKHSTTAYTHLTETTQQLHFQNVTSDQHGCYQCIATNTKGQGKNSIDYCVEVHFVQKTVLSGVTESTEGHNITIKSNVMSFPLPDNLSLSWSSMRDPSMRRLLRNVFKTNIVEIQLNVTAASAGKYICSAQNSEGTKEIEQELTVNYCPKNVEITGLSEDEYDGDVSIQLSCWSVSHPPVNTYKWFRKEHDESGEVYVESSQNLTVHPNDPGIYYCNAYNGECGTNSKQRRLFLNRIAWPLNGIFWVLPFVLLLLLAVIVFLVCRYKRNKLLSGGTPEPYPVPQISDARGSRDDLLLNQGLFHTGNTTSQARQCRPAGPEIQSNSAEIVYSTVNLPTGNQPTREANGCEGDEVNYVSLHFRNQGLSPESSAQAAVKNDVYAKIANKNYENLGRDNQLVDIELNYSTVTFKAKQISGTKI